MKSGILLSLIVLSTALPAFGYETRFEINAEIFNQLRVGEVQVSTHESRGVFYADASAILHANPSQLLEIALDYESYPRLQMPTVVQCRIVERASPDLLYMWSQTTSNGVTSRHYNEVQVIRQINANKASGIKWELTPKASRWTHVQKTSFKRFDGSWFVEPLKDGRVYVRYFLAADFDTGLPDFIMGGMIRRELGNNVRRVIQILAREAALQP
jgi:ribosome-associated toxin RatA of RatAB toxin-antitoxin module